MIRSNHPRAMIRILSVTLTLVVLAASAIIPVNAADHNHQQVDLDATYGQEVTLAIRGK